MKELIANITKNKKYKGIAKTILEETITNYFTKHPKNKKYLKKVKTKKYKQIISAIRSELHAIHGTFQNTKRGKREEYLDDLKKILKNKIEERQILDTHKKLLATNRSTKERQTSYPTLYQTLFHHTGKPKSILDLGCGINPISYPYIDLGKIKYYAYDIDESDMEFLNEYFKIMQLPGKAQTLDLKKIENIKKLPKVDVALLFNLLDSLEQGKGHKLSETIITTLKAKHLVISFATKTISGKLMKHPNRGWIEQLLKRKKLSYETLVSENELFYVIKK
tara:strand:- start:8730 stop:9566 length:837 start_codon:yes stop_codon:yes gene_type:complete